MDDNESVDAKAAKLEEAILGLTTINGCRCFTHNQIPTRLTKVSFDNKSYSDGQYKDGTIHITVDSGHDANHPSPIDPDPLMHILGIALLHYTNPEAHAVAFAQLYIFKAGLKKFGKVGKTAAITKLTQLHTYKTYHPVHAKLLSPEEQKQALLSLMNIVEKRDGRVRAQAVADGSKECTQPGYKKEDGASPTVATNSIMITATIHAHEQRNVTTIDIPGAFLHAYNDKETFMLLKGHLAELMVQVGPQLYRKFVIYDKNNQALLYVKLSKAIYGLLKSALLFYRKFVKDLKNYETPFTINPYNLCVANATINRKQMTITWHVKDLKVSHVNPFQITKFAAYLATIYGNGFVVHQGNIHDNLGMDLNFAADGIAQVSMITYTSKNTHRLPRAHHYILRNPSGGSPLHRTRGKQGQIPARSASPSLPPHSCPTPVPLQTNPKRYPDSCLLPHNTHQTPRRRQLG
jgi:hypothetical protein